MKRTIAALAAGALGVGMALVGIAAPASAHTPSASATCAVLTVKAQFYETKPATPEIPGELISPEVPEQPPVELTPYIPANPGQEYIAPTPEVPEVSHTEWKYTKVAGHGFIWVANDDHKYVDESGSPANWGDWPIYERTQHTKKVVTQPYVPGTPGQEYIAPTPEVPATYSEYVPYQPAVYGEPTPAQPADDTPNTVTVTIDGDVVEDTTFGTDFSSSYTFDNKFVAHDWSVQITAWNDLDGTKGWTKTFEGTSTPCYDTSLRPSMGHSQDCGVVILNFDNPTKYAFAGDYRVDGEAPTHENYYGLGPFYNIVNMPAGTSKIVELPFAEDSGEHTVSYRIGLGAEQDWYLPWVNLTVDTDCEPNPEDPEPSYGEWSTPEITCDSEVGDEIAIERTVTTGEYVLEDGQWVLHESTTTEEGTYTVTAEDVEELDCPLPPAPEKPKPAGLAFTGGGDLSPLAWLAGIITLAGAALWAPRLIRGRN